MDTSQRIPAVIAYIPVIGWLFVLLTQNKNPFAIFHMRQAIGLILFLILVAVVWAAVLWVLSWLPYGFLVGNALFALVIVSFIYGIIAWVIGMVSAGRGKTTLLPVFGRRAARLPIGAL